MKDAIENDPGEVAADPGRSVETIVTDYESTWQNALRGGPVPKVQDFLAPDVADSAELRSQLELIDQKYRRLLESQGKSKKPAEATETKPVRTFETERTIEYGINTPPVFEEAGTISFADASSTDFQVGPSGAPATASEAQSIAPQGYEILGVLGRGGMGVVYDALQVALKRRVALKMITAGAHAGEIQRTRFQTEAEAVARLKHPNIVQIYDIGDHRGIPFFSLEYVDGGILQRKVKDGPMPPREAADMVRQLSEAMDYAHRLGIIHRDLKPANILLTKEGQPKIADFGLAKRIDETDSSQTQAGTVLGTPSYMAPEQAEGEVKEVGPLADVYSLGAVLYHLLTGRPPFQGATMLETLEMVRTQEPVPVRQLVPKVPRDLETICLKCLQKDPRKRYATAEALGRDLHHYQAGEPIEARPVGAPERLWRWCRRHPAEAGLAGAVFLLLATVALTSSVLLVRIAREKAQTEVERQAAIEARDLAEKNEVAAKAAEVRARENAVAASKNGVLAVGSFYSAVKTAQPLLRGLPGSQKVRQQLLDAVIDGLQKVVSGAEDTPLLTRTRIMALQHMGDISKDLGRFDVALGHYQAAQALVEEMAVADPANQVTKYNQGVFYEKIGDVHHQLYGDGVAVRNLYLKSLAFRKELDAVPEPELDPELLAVVGKNVRQPLIGITLTLGDLALKLGDPAEGWRYYQTIVERAFRRKIESPKAALAAANAPNAPAFAIDATVRLGDLAYRLGDPDSAKGWYDRALRQGQARYDQDKTGNAGTLAFVLSALGDFELKQGDAAGAKKLYTQALALAKTRKAADPESARARQSLSMAHYRVGTACLRLPDSDPAEAEKQFQDCLEIRQELAKEDSGNLYYKIDLMQALARCGQFAEAMDRADELCNLAPGDPAMLFYCGCTYALCAHSDRPDAVQLALETLDKAVSNGYRDPVSLKTDPDLDSIRKDSRFKQLVMRAETTAIPGGK